MGFDLSSIAIVEKNKLGRTSVFIVLLQITLPDTTVLRLSSDNTNTTWNGQTWVAFPFEIDDIGEESQAVVPQFEIRVGNASKAIQAYIEPIDGGVNSEVVIYVVNSLNLADPNPEFTGNVKVVGANSDPLWVHFVLGASNPYNQRFPKNRMLKNFCNYGVTRSGYGFKGNRCQYVYTPWTSTKYVDHPDIEIDPNSRIAIEAETLSFSNLGRNESVCVYRDMNTDYFDNDFEHQLQVKIISGASEDSVVFLWGLANTVNNFYGLFATLESCLGLYAIVTSGFLYLFIVEFYGSAVSDQSVAISFDTDYYLTIKRDESIGTYGKLYCYIYSDSDRTVLVDTLELSLRSKENFRYKYAVSSYNSGDGLYMSGYMRYFKYTTCNRTLARCRELKNSQHFGGAAGVGRRGLYV